MTPQEINDIGLFSRPSNPDFFSDNEDVGFNLKTKELWALDCVGNDDEVICRGIKNIEDLKQKIWDNFPSLRRHLNL